jgi:hypothetical protein
MNVMTVGTLKGRMLALIFFEHPNFWSVAYKTGIFARALQGYIQRPVRVCMTVEAPGCCYFKMGIPRLQMAIMAWCNWFLHFRWMTVMAA